MRGIGGHRDVLDFIISNMESGASFSLKHVDSCARIPVLCLLVLR